MLQVNYVLLEAQQLQNAQLENIRMTLDKEFALHALLVTLVLKELDHLEQYSIKLIFVQQAIIVQLEPLHQLNVWLVLIMD